MKLVQIRFHPAFNPLLPRLKREVWFSIPVEENQTIKHVVESLGVPHTEIGQIRVDGKPAGLDTRVLNGDRLEVDPVLSSPSPVLAGFVLDTHLGRLAAYLRMLGFDSIYHTQADDADLARISSQEGRILLTRDRGLLKRSQVTQGFLVIDDDPHRQIVAVLRRYSLSSLIRPFERCMRCNGVLVPVEKHQVEHLLPDQTRRWYDEFHRCPDCGGIYWKGAHYHRMKALIDQILGDK